MDFDVIKQLLTDFDLANFLPALDSVIGWIELVTRIAVLSGPLLMLGLGLWYFLAPPKEANHSIGYRFYWGMSSVECWQFTQRLAGIVWSGLGLILSIVMAIICNGYRGMDTMDMLYNAVICLLWEAGLTLLSILAINITVMIRYDGRGYLRHWWDKENS